MVEGLWLRAYSIYSVYSAYSIYSVYSIYRYRHRHLSFYARILHFSPRFRNFAVDIGFIDAIGPIDAIGYIDAIDTISTIHTITITTITPPP